MIETFAPNESLTIPLDGLSEASIRLAFGGGELTLGRAEPGTLVSGTFDGGVVQKSRERGVVDLEPADPGRRFLEGCRNRWHVDLTPDIPVDLRLDTGANKSTIDLGKLRVRRLDIHTGASDTFVRLPAEGQTQLRLKCGFAQVVLEVPEDMAAHIRGKISFGDTKVDEARFSRTSDGWQSPDYHSAADHVDIEISGGFGTVHVR